jgi:hypothetical protein
VGGITAMSINQKRVFASPLGAIVHSKLGARGLPESALFVHSGSAYLFDAGVVDPNITGIRVHTCRYRGYFENVENFGVSIFGFVSNQCRGLGRFGDYFVVGGQWNRGSGPANTRHIAFYDLVNGGWVDPAPGTSTVGPIEQIVVGSSGTEIYVRFATGGDIDGVTLSGQLAYYDSTGWHDWAVTDGTHTVAYIWEPDVTFGGEVFCTSITSVPLSCDKATLAEAFNTDGGSPPYIITALTNKGRHHQDSGEVLSSRLSVEDTVTDFSTGVLRWTSGTTPDVWPAPLDGSAGGLVNLAGGTNLTRAIYWNGNILVASVDGLTTCSRANADGSTTSGITDRFFQINPTTGLVDPSNQLSYPDTFIHDIVFYDGKLFCIGSNRDGSFPPIYTGIIRVWNTGTSTWDLVRQFSGQEVGFHFKVVNTTI